MDLAEAEAEGEDLSARMQWAGRGEVINPFYFCSVWHNHSELKTSWLALMFENSLSGWFKGSFWGQFPKRVSFGRASSTLRLT